MGVQKAIAEKQDWFNRMCADVQNGQDIRPPCAGLPVLPGEGVVLAHGEQHPQQTQAKGGTPSPTPGGGSQGRGNGDGEGGEESKASEDAPPQKQAEMDVD